MVLPALLVVLAGCLAAISAVAAQLHCTDAAGLGARAAARGDPDEAVVAAVVASAPRAVVAVTRADGLVSVRVTLPVDVLPASGLAPLSVTTTAVAADEAALPAAAR